MTDFNHARADALLDQIEKLTREVRLLIGQNPAESESVSLACDGGRGGPGLRGGRWGRGRRREEERNPAFFDGRNLSPEGLAELHRLFESGVNPYAAAQALGVSPRAAYMRHYEWLRSRGEAPPADDK